MGYDLPVFVSGGRNTLATVEVIAAVFGGISAAKDAIDFWRDTGGSPQVRSEFARLRVEPSLTLNAFSAAVDANKILPDYVMDVFVKRVDNCFQMFVKVMTGPFMPQELDDASENIIHCVCSELRRLRRVNGGVLPSQWNELWERYNCSADP